MSPCKAEAYSTENLASSHSKTISRKSSPLKHKMCEEKADRSDADGPWLLRNTAAQTLRGLIQRAEFPPTCSYPLHSIHSHPYSSRHCWTPSIRRQALGIHMTSYIEETFWCSQSYEDYYPTLWAMYLQTVRQVLHYLEAIPKSEFWKQISCPTMSSLYSHSSNGLFTLLHWVQENHSLFAIIIL